jgi:hypothetical protein
MWIDVSIHITLEDKRMMTTFIDVGMEKHDVDKAYDVCLIDAKDKFEKVFLESPLVIEVSIAKKCKMIVDVKSGIREFKWKFKVVMR